MGLLKAGSIFALGYAVGTRAGRERYEQLLADARRLVQHPAVQQASTRLPASLQLRLTAFARGSQQEGVDPASTRAATQNPSHPVGSVDVDELVVIDLAGPDAPLETETVAAAPPPEAPAVAVSHQLLSSTRPLIDPVVVPGRGLPRSTQRKPQ